MGHNSDSYWRIFKGVRIFVKEEMPNSKEVRPGQWEKPRQPVPGESESVSAHQQGNYPVQEAQTFWH